ncbi:hypothetical protein TorRG33x02_243520 [Trema orientale]|uniref:Uncharacterized protein n=1 Tax=Trema orientale TaxID=63057 RepID=A0A2P5DS87_TREOI|nr:hypothetical protein TorRG33x02_243520 [Trema orientale]
MPHIFHGLLVCAVPLLVEREDDHGHALLLRCVADILVHGGERRYGRSGRDGHSAELLVRLESPGDAVVPLATAEAVEEGEAILADSLDHDNGGGALCELHKVHDEKLERRLLGATRGLHDADEGRRVAWPMDAR